MLAQCCFDFAQFDAMAARLDLMVETSQELEIAVAPPTNEITGAVEPLAGVKGVVDESLGRQLGIVQKPRASPRPPT